MSEEKWTTGPWKPVWNGTIGKYSVQAGKTATYGVFREHDAYLIAAAPDLYAALKSALLLVDMSTSYRRQDIAEMGKNALKKARGES